MAKYFKSKIFGYRVKLGGVDYKIAGNIMPKLAAPVCTYDTDRTANISITNNNSVIVMVFIDNVYKGTLSANATQWYKVGRFNTYYSIYFTADSSYNQSDTVSAYSGPTQLTAPVCDWDTDEDIDINVKNNNSVTVDVYVDYSYRGKLAAGDSGWYSVRNFEDYYDVYFSASNYSDSDITTAYSGYYET